MFDNIKKIVFSRGIPPEPNMFIGGVGETLITSPADYVALSSDISVGQIEVFEIDAEFNVSFYTNRIHRISTTWATSLLKYWVDVDGRIRTVADFNGASGLRNAYFPNLTLSMNRFSVRTVNSLKSFFTNQLLISEGGIFETCNALKYLYFGTVTQITQSRSATSVGKMALMERVYLGKNTYVNPAMDKASQLSNTGRGWLFYLLGGATTKFYYNPALGVADRFAWNTFRGSWLLGDRCTINGLQYDCVAGTVQPTNDGEFITADVSGATVGAESLRLAINSDSRIGTYSNVSATFRDVNIVVIQCDTVGIQGDSIACVTDIGTPTFLFPTLQGGSDVSITYANVRDRQGVQLVECLDFTVPSPVVDLAVPTINSGSVKVTFTPPASTNALDFYEVYVENISLDKWNKDRVATRLEIHQEITGSGATITGLDSETKYKIKIVACDIYWNRSDESNEIEFETPLYDMWIDGTDESTMILTGQDVDEINAKQSAPATDSLTFLNAKPLSNNKIEFGVTQKLKSNQELPIDLNDNHGVFMVFTLSSTTTGTLYTNVFSNNRFNVNYHTTGILSVTRYNGTDNIAWTIAFTPSSAVNLLEIYIENDVIVAYLNDVLMTSGTLLYAGGSLSGYWINGQRLTNVTAGMMVMNHYDWIWKKAGTTQQYADIVTFLKTKNNLP